MIFRIKTEIVAAGLVMTHEHEQEFSDDSNVFGRTLEYHRYLDKVMPKGYEYKLISAEQIG